MTVAEIVTETVEYYKTHPRASVEGRCKYITAEGNQCAIGRCVSVETCDHWISAGIGPISDLTIEDLENALFPQYRGHSLDFWRSLQILHDKKSYWHNGALTLEGGYYKDQIIEAYGKA